MPFIKLQNTIVNTDNILYATIIETNSFDKNLLIKFRALRILNEHFLEKKLIYITYIIKSQR